MKNNLKFYFNTAISGYDLRLAQMLYSNQFKSSLSYLPLKMDDTCYKSIQISKNLTKNQEIFLIGLFTGIVKTGFLLEYVDKYGDSIGYHELDI